MAKLFILVMTLLMLVGVYMWGSVISQADQRAHNREQARLVYLEKMGLNQ